MPEQETLHTDTTFDPRQHGLYRRFITDNTVNEGAWLRARAEGGFVGTCRQCGGYLRPERPRPIGERRVDYEAVCISCTARMIAPNGRVLTRSSRRSERPNKGGNGDR